MPAALAIALVWGGYTAGLYGYCLLRGYNVTLKQLLSSNWPPGSVPTSKSGPQGGSGFGPGAGVGGGAGGGGGGSW
jgi:hypothetical protein